MDSNYHEICSPFGLGLYKKVWENARRRDGLENRWFEDTLQYLGEYDQKTQERLAAKDTNSKLYVNLTRAKVRTMAARLCDSLFPTDEATWDIQPTPVPRLERALARREGAEEYPLQKEELAKAEQAMRLAKERAQGMHRLIDDQLIESRYVHIGRAVIRQACKLGVGIMKGPIATDDVRRRWTKDGDGWKLTMLPNSNQDMHPRFKRVDAWDFYPDMDAGSMRDCEFTYELQRMSTTEIRQHARTGMFDDETVRFMIEHGYDWQTDPGHFGENLKWVKMLENDSTYSNTNRFYVFEYNGPISFDDFKTLAEHYKKEEQLAPFRKMKDDVIETLQGRVWFCNDQILRFAVNPLPSEELPYSVFRLDPSENTLIGSHGIPRMLRDPQSSLNAAWRMSMEAAGLQGAPMVIIDRSRINPIGTRKIEIGPKQAFETKPGTSFAPQDGGVPIQEVSLSGNMNGILAMIDRSIGLMDDESSIPILAHGDGAAGAKQTAHGMTLIANAMNVIFRDAARGFDGDLTIPSIQRLFDWNMRWSDDVNVKGDMEIHALGSSSLLISELASQNLLMLMNLVSANPDSFASVNFDELLVLWVKQLRLDRYGLLKSKQEVEQDREAAKNQPPPIDPAVEAKREITQMEIDAKERQIAMQLEVEVLKVMEQSKLTREQIMAGVEKTLEHIRSKERMQLAETAVKEKHGTGI